MTDDEWLGAYRELVARTGRFEERPDDWIARVIRAHLLCEHLAADLDAHPPPSDRRRQLARAYARAYRLLTVALSRIPGPDGVATPAILFTGPG